VILRVNVPVDAVRLVVTIKLEVAVLPDGGITGVGRENATFEGAVPTQEADRSTAELNPFVDPMVIVEVPPSP